MNIPIEFFAISGIINGIVALVYGSYILARKRNDVVAFLFFLMTAAMAVWGFSYWKWLRVENIDSALFWIRALTIGSFLISTFYLHWILQFLGNKQLLSRLLLLLNYGASLAGIVFIASPLIISGLGPQLHFPYWPSAGPLYTGIVFLQYIVTPVFACVLIMRRMKVVHATTDRVTLIFLLLGTILGFGSGLTNFPLWYGIPFPPYGTFLNVAFPLLFGYGSVRHGMFNIKAIGSELLVAFILAVLLVEMLLARTDIEYLFRAMFLFVVGILSYLLIRSIHIEIENREKGERLARYLANANARLRELDRQKTEFVSVASHQLRSPIAAIKGYTSLMLDGSYGKVPKGLELPLGRILESGQRMTLMVDDFLDVTRIEQGRMSYSMKRHDLNELVGSVVDELRVIAEKKGLTFKFLCRAGKPVWVTADEGKLKQIFSNLIDNAIKYTPEGSVTVEIECLKTNHAALVKINDNGIGIAPEERDKLFHKFNRASNANKASVYGTGLGLYIAKDIIKAHNGWIHVSSPGIGKGSTFTVELPLAESNRGPKATDGAKPEEKADSISD